MNIFVSKVIGKEGKQFEETQFKSDMMRNGDILVLEEGGYALAFEVTKCEIWFNKEDLTITEYADLLYKYDANFEEPK